MALQSWDPASSSFRLHLLDVDFTDACFQKLDEALAKICPSSNLSRLDSRLQGIKRGLGHSAVSTVTNYGNIYKNIEIIA